GPFICRNHYASYINLCLGLGVGLLLSVSLRKRRSSWRPESRRFRWPGLQQLVHDPRALWIAAGLALMLSSVVVSLSGGGVLALVAGALVCLAIRTPRLSGALRVPAAFVVAGMAIALTIWIGLGPIEARLATVFRGSALHESRIPLWSRVLPAAW